MEFLHRLLHRNTGGGGHSSSPKTPPKASEHPSKNTSEAHLSSKDGHDVVSAVKIGELSPKLSGPAPLKNRDGTNIVHQIPEKADLDREVEDDENFEDAEENKSNLTVLAEDLDKLHLGTPAKTATISVVTHEFVDTKLYEVNLGDLSSSDFSFESYDANDFNDTFMNNTLDQSNCETAIPTLISSGEEMSNSIRIESNSEDKETICDLSLTSITSTKGNATEENNQNISDSYVFNNTVHSTPTLVHCLVMPVSSDQYKTVQKEVFDIVNNADSPITEEVKINEHERSQKEVRDLLLSSLKKEVDEDITEISSKPEKQIYQESDCSNSNICNKSYDIVGVSGFQTVPSKRNNSEAFNSNDKNIIEEINAKSTDADITGHMNVLTLNCSEEHKYIEQISEINIAQLLQGFEAQSNLIAQSMASEDNYVSSGALSRDEVLILRTDEISEEYNNSSEQFISGHNLVVSMSENQINVLPLSETFESSISAIDVPDKKQDLDNLKIQILTNEDNYIAADELTHNTQTVSPVTEENITIKLEDASCEKLISRLSIVNNDVPEDSKAEIPNDCDCNCEEIKTELEHTPPLCETFESPRSSSDLSGNKQDLDNLDDLKTQITTNENNCVAVIALSDDTQIVSPVPEGNITITLDDTSCEKLISDQSIVYNNVHEDSKTEKQNHFDCNSEGNKKEQEHALQLCEAIESRKSSTDLQANEQDPDNLDNLKTQFSTNEDNIAVITLNDTRNVCPVQEGNITIKLDDTSCEKSISGLSIVNNDVYKDSKTEKQNHFECDSEGNKIELEHALQLCEAIESRRSSTDLQANEQDPDNLDNLKTQFSTNEDNIAVITLNDTPNVCPVSEGNLTIKLDDTSCEKSISGLSIVNNDVSKDSKTEKQNHFECNSEGNKIELKHALELCEAIESRRSSTDLLANKQDPDNLDNLKKQFSTNEDNIAVITLNYTPNVFPVPEGNITIKLDDSSCEKSISGLSIVNNDVSKDSKTEKQNHFERNIEGNKTELERALQLCEAIESQISTTDLPANLDLDNLDDLKTQITTNEDNCIVVNPLSDNTQIVCLVPERNISIILDDTSCEKSISSGNVTEDSKTEKLNNFDRNSEGNKTELEQALPLCETIQSLKSSTDFPANKQDLDNLDNPKTQITLNALNNKVKTVCPMLNEINTTEIDNSSCEKFITDQHVYDNALEVTINYKSEKLNEIEHNDEVNRPDLNQTLPLEVEGPSTIVSTKEQELDGAKIQTLANEEVFIINGAFQPTLIKSVSAICINSELESEPSSTAADMTLPFSNAKQSFKEKENKLYNETTQSDCKLDTNFDNADAIVSPVLDHNSYAPLKVDGNELTSLSKIQSGASSSVADATLSLFSTKQSLEEKGNTLYNEFSQTNLKIDTICSKSDAIISSVSDDNYNAPLSIYGKDSPSSPKLSPSKTIYTSSVFPNQNLKSTLEEHNKFFTADKKEFELKYDEKFAEEAANLSDHILSLSQELQDSDSDGENNKTVITVLVSESAQPSLVAQNQTIITSAYIQRRLFQESRRKDNEVLKSKQLFSSETDPIKSYIQSMPSELNQSEAGPITADELSTQDLEFQDGANLDLDYFNRVGNSKSVGSSLARCSLYVKFDPIVGAIVSDTVSDSITMPPPLAEGETNNSKEQHQIQPEEEKDASVSQGQGESQRTPGRSPALEAVQKLISLTPPSAPSTPAKSIYENACYWGWCPHERSSVGSSSPITPSPRAPSDSLRKELAKMEDLAKSKELFFKAELEKERNRVSELEAQSKIAAERELALKKELHDRTKSRQQLSLVMEEYEKTISQLVAQKEEEKKEFEMQKDLLMKERDTAMQHLNNMEIAFNDVHQKYERSKTVIEGMKANEDLLKKSLAEYDDLVKSCNSKYDSLKNHAVRQLDTANTELDLIRRSHQVELAKLKAMLKKAEVRVTSLEESLEQKSKENQELAAICDELISKVGGTN